MRIEPVENKYGKPTPAQITFTYKSPLKKDFLKGLIPLTRDITGRPLDAKTVSLDHTYPISKGGKSNIYNYNLMNKFVNRIRGVKPIKQFIDIEALVEYLDIMINTKTMNIDGVDYVKGFLKNLLKDFKLNSKGDI